jgi:hypothetical protein
MQVTQRDPGVGEQVDGVVTITAGYTLTDQVGLGKEISSPVWTMIRTMHALPLRRCQIDRSGAPRRVVTTAFSKPAVPPQ